MDSLPNRAGDLAFIAAQAISWTMTACCCARETYDHLADLAEVGYHLIGAALKERCCLRAAPDPDDKAESPGASRGDARGRILKDRGAHSGNTETPRGFQEHVRSRLAAQAETVKINTIHARIERLLAKHVTA